MKVKRIEVEVSKTLQVAQYEPVTVRLNAQAELDADADLDESYKELYKQVSKSTKLFIQNELTKHLMEVENNKIQRDKRK